MAFSKEAFIDGYVAESREHIENITLNLSPLKENPKSKVIVKEILRNLHTIKGSSRMMDFLSMEQLSHALEGVFKSVLEERHDFTRSMEILVIKCVECLESIIRNIENSGEDETDVSVYVEICDKASKGDFIDMEELLARLEGDKSELEFDEEAENDINYSLDSISSVRININRINDIIKGFDNLIIRQFRLKHQIETLSEKIRSSDGNSQIQVPKQLSEDILAVEEAVFATQHQIFELRMLPLDMILNPIKKEIVSESVKLDKNIEIDIPSTSFMLDKMVLEQVRTVLLHLIRNSIDHGIESETERIALGKKPAGLISIKAVQISNRLLVTVMDDGRGIQYDKIREKAISFFPDKEEEIQFMSDKDLQQYIYAAGFSTSETATEISGRGMGMDIVRSSMEKIKGKIKITSALNEGTTFELSIPLSMATQRGLFVYVGGIKLMIPSHYIQEIVTCSEDKLVVMQSQTYISVHKRLIPLYYLASILEVEKPEEINSVIIIEYLETRMAIVVDTIDQNENVIVNPMPEILRGIKSLQGVVYDEKYAIVPILDIPCLMKMMKGLVAYDIKRYQTKNRKKKSRVLVVDDSVTTRQIEKAIFETDGYFVETAVDGIDALEKLKQNHVDIIVTDITMPRMDGKTLLSNIRRLKEYAETPVVVVSSSNDEELKQEFLDAGAQMFIIKSDFQRGNLLQAVRELLGGQ